MVGSPVQLRRLHREVVDRFHEVLTEHLRVSRRSPRRGMQGIRHWTGVTIRLASPPILLWVIEEPPVLFSSCYWLHVGCRLAPWCGCMLLGAADCMLLAVLSGQCLARLRRHAYHMLALPVFCQTKRLRTPAEQQFTDAGTVQSSPA